MTITLKKKNADTEEMVKRQLSYPKRIADRITVISDETGYSEPELMRMALEYFVADVKIEETPTSRVQPPSANSTTK